MSESVTATPKRDGSLSIAALDESEVEQLTQQVGQAIQHHQAGEFDEAEAVYRRILAVHPCNPTALHFLGLLQHGRGDSKEAERLIGRAIAFNPEYADAFNNLGKVFYDRGKLLEAGVCYQRAAALAPDNLITMGNLAPVLRELREFDSAITICEQILERNPDSFIAHYTLGMSHFDSGRADKCVPNLKEAYRLDPNSKTRYNLGMALHSAKQTDEAKQFFADWVRDDPDHAVAKHMAAAYGSVEGTTPQRAEDEYVRDIFDGFAASFDYVLGRLDYRVPQIIAELMPQLYASADASLDVLDAGCGTGLCGQGLRPYAKTLVGADLSSGMLAEAAKLGLYDDLDEAELTAYLNEQSDQFDLIVSGDTLCYFGALTDVLAASTQALRKGGRLVFTIERHDDDEPFKLHPHGRYSHGRDYVEQSLAAAGFDEIGLGEVELRIEAKKPVRGYLVISKLGG